MTGTLALPVLTALVESRREWASIDQLAKRSGLSDYIVAEVVRELRIDGYLDVWARKRAPVVTFSAWGAHILGYRLFDDGSDRPRRRWVRSKSTDPAPRRPRPRQDLDDQLVEDLADEAPGPPAIAEAAEEAEASAVAERERRSRKGLPFGPDDVARPAVILTGHSLATWNETDNGGSPSGYCPEENRGERSNKVPRSDCACRRDHARKLVPTVCPGCHGRELSRSTYCARCGRWGWDRYFFGAPRRVKRRA